ncbi:MAG: thiaminase II [Pseudomonadota bacterium]|nr:thiaminase II [Pseudomonadota bacterium]
MAGLFARLKAAAAPEWQAYTHHEFVAGLGDGTLPQAAFRHYLVQDYLFLIHFSRAWALAVYKSTSLADMRAAAEVLNGILNTEMALHVDYCRGFGISPAEMEAAPEDAPCMAYTRYVLETGMAGDILDLHVALSPCVIGYGEIGARLAADPATRHDGNPYASWIAMYSGPDYAAVMQAALAQLDRLAEARLTGARFPELARIFSEATRLEAGFWQMGLDAAR